MLYLFTEDYFFRSRLKKIIRRFLGKEESGPDAVVKSLLKGLTELGIDFCLNEPIRNNSSTICVLNGAEILNWAIKQKGLGKIKQLIAGPNIVITPFDNKSIIQNKTIDKIILPSRWVIDWWDSLVPGLKNKCHVWASGVDDRGGLNKQSAYILIYYKSGDKRLINNFETIIKRRGLKSKVLFYGKFKQQKYLSLLERASFLINIGSSESQGLAMNEAWMANVPTLVLNLKKMNYKDYVWQDENIAAPYMSRFCGNFFSASDDLELVFNKFLAELETFNPRQYSLNNFSNKIAARKFLEIVNK